MTRLQWILTLALALAACSNPDGSQSVDVFKLKLGDCANGSLAGATVDAVDRLSCDQPHVYEVYHVFDLRGSEFPGDKEVGRLAEEGCVAAFEGFVGESYQDSKWFLSYLQPNADGWVRIGDREVVCMVHNEAESKVSGSARSTLTKG